MRLNSTRTVLCGLLLFVSLVIAACGGGGGAAIPIGAFQTVSGVAAAGSAMVGQVSLVDAKGTLAAGSPLRLDANGGFAFNVLGMTPPFILKAEGTVGGTSMTMFSVAMGTGTANINPMSNIAVAAAAGVNDPATVFNNPATNAPKITSTSLGQAISAMQTMLAPVLGQFGATGLNPVTGAYTANHAGLDGVFDVVQMPIVNTTTGAITVMDKTSGTTGATIGSATVTNLAAAPPVSRGVTMPGVPGDLQNIASMLNNMGAVMNKGLALTAADLEPYFVADPGFGINGGMTRTQMMSTTVTLAQAGTHYLGAVTGLTNVTFNGNSPGGGYRIMFGVRFADGSLSMSNLNLSDETVVMKNASNVWQFKGNGLHSMLLNTMENQQWQTATGTQREAGMFFGMLDNGNVFRSATVTGPGMTGVQFVKEAAPNQTLFMLATPNTTIPSMGAQFFTMPDTTITTIPDNAPYTFSFYSSLPPRNNPMETRTMTFPKRCFTRTEAVAGNIFPTMSPSGNMMTHSFSTMMGNMMGGMMPNRTMSMPFTYAAPTGMPVAVMGSSLSITSATFNPNPSALPLLLHGSSATMSMQGPVSQPTSGTGALDVHATDIFGRDAGAAWMFQ